MSAVLFLAVGAVVVLLAVVLAALVWAARGPGAVRDPRPPPPRTRRRGLVSGSRE